MLIKRRCRIQVAYASCPYEHLKIGDLGSSTCVCILLAHLAILLPPNEAFDGGTKHVRCTEQKMKCGFSRVFSMARRQNRALTPSKRTSKALISSFVTLPKYSFGSPSFFDEPFRSIFKGVSTRFGRRFIKTDSKRLIERFVQPSKIIFITFSPNLCSSNEDFGTSERMWMRYFVNTFHHI